MLCFQFVNLFLLLIRIYSINTPNCTQKRHICFSFSIFKTCVNPHNHPTPESTPPVVISTSSHLPVQLIRAFITPLCCFCLHSDRTRSRRPRRAAGGRPQQSDASPLCSVQLAELNTDSESIRGSAGGADAAPALTDPAWVLSLPIGPASIKRSQQFI